MSRGKTAKGKQMLGRPRQVLNTELSKEANLAVPKGPNPGNLGLSIPFSEEFKKHDANNSVLAIERTSDALRLAARNTRTHS